MVMHRTRSPPKMFRFYRSLFKNLLYLTMLATNFSFHDQIEFELFIHLEINEMVVCGGKRSNIFGRLYQMLLVMFFLRYKINCNSSVLEKIVDFQQLKRK